MVFNLHIWANSIWSYIIYLSQLTDIIIIVIISITIYIIILYLKFVTCVLMKNWKKKNTLLNSWWSFIFSSGYYPKGGGEVHVAVNPIKQLRPLQLLERGPLARITGRAFVAGVLPLKVSCYQCYLIMNCYSQKWSWVGFLFKLHFYLHWDKTNYCYYLCPWHCFS